MDSGWVGGMVQWLDAHNGAVLALLTLVLVGVTAWYASTTHRMMETARQQRLDAAMPIMVVKDGAVPQFPGYPDKFRLNLENRGLGPALNMYVALAEPALPYQVDHPIGPHIAEVGWEASFMWSVRPEPEPPEPEATLPQRLVAKQQRFEEFRRSLPLADIESPGVLQVRYEDVHGRRIVTEANLICVDAPNLSWWPKRKVTVGQVRVQLPDASVGGWGRARVSG